MRSSEPSRCPNPACGAQEVATVLERAESYRLDDAERTFHFRFACCRACRLGFVEPQPAADVLAAFYPSAYAYWTSVPAAPSLATRAKYSLAKWRHQRVLGNGTGTALKGAIARVVESVARRDASFTLAMPLCLGRDARVLDYGFGSGDFLLALRALGFTRLSGYDVEANRPGRQRLRAAGIEAFCGDELARIPDARFDCIRLEHVLEHLPAPIDTLSALRAKLRPGGVLVLTVPSIHAWEPVERLAGSAHLAHLQLPVHLWHHSNRSIRDFLAAAGFEPLEVRLLRPFRYLSAVSRR